MKATINFDYQTEFRIKNEPAFSYWLSRIIEREQKTAVQIDYIFTDDESLLNINRQYLNHDTYTDIITFDYSSTKGLMADIVISVERVKENARTYNVAFEDELKRVMCHGILHLLGWGDKTDEEKRKMRKKENEVMKLFHVKQ